MDLMRTISEKTALAAIIPDQHLRIRIDAVPANVPHAWLREKTTRHVRVSEIWLPVRRDPPKILAHHPILVERASCPQRPRDCNYGRKADHASEADQHDVEIIGTDVDLDGRAKLPSEELKARQINPATTDLDRINYRKKIYDLTEGLVRRKYTDRNIELILGGNFQRALCQIWTA